MYRCRRCTMTGAGSTILSTFTKVTVRRVGRLFDHNQNLLTLLAALLVVGVASVGVSGSSGDRDDVTGAGTSDDYDQLELHYETVNSVGRINSPSLHHVNRFNQQLSRVLPVSDREEHGSENRIKSSAVSSDDWDEFEGHYNKIEKSPVQDSSASGLSRNELRNDTGSGQEQGIQRLPQAIIIGVKKGGTRALLEFLRIHPDVRAPGPEVHFFDRYYHRGLDWYRSQMPPTIDGQVTIEKTPSYFVTKAAPERVFNMSADVRLIVVVRDPVTRAISDYAQAVAKRPDLPPFNRMAFRGGNSTSDRHRQGDTTSVAMSWGAIKIGLYARHLERWLRYFPPSQMHFVHGERLIGDPAGEMALLQDFLGLRRHVTEKHFYFNATKGFPCIVSPTTQSTPSPLQLAPAEKLPQSSIADKIRLNRKKTSLKAFVGTAASAPSSSVASFSSGTDADTDERSESVVETGSGNVQSTFGGGIRCLGKTKGRAHPIVDDLTLKLLRDFFRPFNEKFYRMTGINFGWP